MCDDGADFRIGKDCQDILLIGACPGRVEEEQNRPFIGDAGQNLRTMISALSESRPNLFPSAVADDYSMLNAHDLPRYEGREGFDGESEPSQEEIMQPTNILRLWEQIAFVFPSVLLYLGDTAEFIHPIVEEVAPDAEVYKTGHPSKPAWNTRKEYRGMSKDDKLARWATDKFLEL